MENLAEKIDRLADLRADFELRKAKFEADNCALTDEISGLESEIKAEILKKGETFSTEKMSAIWVKGRESWDGKILTGYAVAHPEILAAKKISAPTVRFAPVKK